jgi:hypothetical protein
MHLSMGEAYLTAAVTGIVLLILIGFFVLFGLI